jgi:hypothetical protein
MSWSKTLNRIQKGIATAAAVRMYIGVENTTLKDSGNEINSLILL